MVTFDFDHRHSVTDISVPVVSATGTNGALAQLLHTVLSEGSQTTIDKGAERSRSHKDTNRGKDLHGVGESLIYEFQ